MTAALAWASIGLTLVVGMLVIAALAFGAHRRIVHERDRLRHLPEWERRY